MSEQKVIRNNKVAVAISPGHGAGWTTWNSKISPFEPKVIEMIEGGKRAGINEEWCREELGLPNVYCGGAEDLEIEWLDVGEKFSINDEDGHESLYIASKLEHEA